MASIPNQTNIVNIIKSNVESMDDLIMFINNDINRISKIINIKKFLKNIHSYDELLVDISNLFAKTGGVYIFIDVISKISSNTIKENTAKLGYLSNLYKNMTTAMVDLQEFIKTVESQNLNWAKVSKFVGQFSFVFNKLIEVWVKNTNTINATSVKQISDILDLYMNIAYKTKETTALLFKTRTFLIMRKLLKLRKAMRAFNILVRIISSFAITKMIQACVNAVFMVVIAQSINLIISSLHGIITLFILKKLMRMHKIIKMFNIIIKKIALIKTRTLVSAVLKLNLMITVIGVFSTLIMTVIAMSVPLLLFLLVSPILLLSVTVLVGVIWMIKLLVKVAGRGLVGVLMYIVGITLILIILAATMIHVAIVGKKLWENILGLLAFTTITLLFLSFVSLIGLLLLPYIPIMLLILIPLSLLIVIAGIVFSLGLVILMIQTIPLNTEKVKIKTETIINTVLLIKDLILDKIGLSDIVSGIVAAVFLTLNIVLIGLLLVIEIGLMLIQIIPLDKKKVQENIRNIMSSCKLLLDSIFMSEAEIDKQQDPPGWVVSIFRGGGQIIKAILAVTYVALVLVAVILMLCIAAGLRIIQMIEINPDAIKTTVQTIMSCVDVLISSIFTMPGKTESSGESKPWYTSILDYVGGPIVRIIGAVMAIASFGFIIITVALMLIIAKQLESLQKIKLDSAAVSTNVQTILDTATTIANMIFGYKFNQQSDDENKGFFGKLLNWINPFKGISGIIDAISSIGRLSLVAISVGILHKIAEQLDFIQQIKFESNILAQAENILSNADQINSLILDQKIDRRKIRTLRRTRIFYESLPAVLAALQSSCDAASKLSQTADIKDVEPKIAEIVDITKKINTMKLDRQSFNRLKYMSRLGHVLRQYVGFDKAQVDQSERLLNNYVKFVDKVNNIKLENLQSATAMFKQMSEFSNSISGDFEKLADSLNEKIAPLLEELKTLMEGLPSKIDESTSSINSSISANSTNTNMSSDEAAAQARRNDPNATEQEIERRTKQRMDEQARIQSASVITKIDELLETIRGNSSVGPMPVRMS